MYGCESRSVRAEATWLRVRLTNPNPNYPHPNYPHPHANPNPNATLTLTRLRALEGSFTWQKDSQLCASKRRKEWVENYGAE